MEIGRLVSLAEHQTGRPGSILMQVLFPCSPSAFSPKSQSQHSVQTLSWFKRVRAHFHGNW